MKYIKEYKDIDWDFEEEEERVPDEFKGHEDFYNFLVDNGVLDQWINNLGNKNIPDLLNKDINIINYAFNWTSTEEGFNFWYKIHKKWINEKYRLGI
jgi:hypothetical protein